MTILKIQPREPVIDFKKLIRQNSHWFFLLPFLVFILLRASLLRLPPFGDEDQLIRDAVFLGHSAETGYPILGLFFLRIGLFFLDWNHLRWVPFAFSVGVFILTALITEELLGFEGALWSLWLLSISPLNISVSTQLLFDGSFVAFFLLLMVYFYLRFLRNPKENRIFLILCGVAFGCLWLTSYAAFSLAAGAALYAILSRKLHAVLDIVTIGILGLLVFSVYPLLLPHHYHLSAQKLAVVRSIPILKFKSHEWLYFSSWAKALIFVGPLLLWGLFRALLSGDLRRRVGLPLSICVSYMILILTLVNPDRTMGYWSPLIPFFCLATAAAIMEEQKTYSIFSLSVLITTYYVLMAILTQVGPHAVSSSHPLRWSWMNFFPIRMFYGPSLALYLRPAAVIFPFLAIFFLALSTLRWKKLRAQIIALGLAYGLFCSGEYVHPLFSPDSNAVGQKLLSSLKQKPPQEPVYLHGYGALECEMNGIKVQPFMYDESVIEKLLPLMTRTKGSVILMNSPAIGPETPLRRFLSTHATLKREFSSDSISLAEVWRLQ